MPAESSSPVVLAEGAIPFSIESRLIRELGERLVRRPEVALLELVKNAYDADATRCQITFDSNGLTVADDGTGITLDSFTDSWMRIGTSAKRDLAHSPRFGRPTTGEKGIGRFAVRYLGQTLTLRSTAYDEGRRVKTLLEATFNWKNFDKQSDLGSVKVPYTLVKAEKEEKTGTSLSISKPRLDPASIDWKALQTGSLGIVSPIRTLLRERPAHSGSGKSDPGFDLTTASGASESKLADTILARYAIRATIEVRKRRVKIRVYRSGNDKAYLTISEALDDEIGNVDGDIRFFPRRGGLFEGASFDGRVGYSFVRENSGVRVYDRGFQVHPYGMAGDDWLDLTADIARNLRDPRSAIMLKHYPMDQAVKSSTALNWMLRLPDNKQMIGVIEVEGRRETEASSALVASADREGFVDNDAFRQLRNIVRGAIEAIAYADREISLDEERQQLEAGLAKLQEDTRHAIAEIDADRELTQIQKSRIVDMLVKSQEREERQREGSKEREQQLEVMSLLGVLGGFMTHEFGIALSELRAARKAMQEMSASIPDFAERARSFDDHIEALQAFVRYSRAYVEGIRNPTDKPYPARARIAHVTKAFERYAEKRRIDVIVDVEPDVMVPPLPASLYDGIAQNLLTNSLKAITASSRRDDRRVVFRAWNEKGWHRMQVSDTGVGIPTPIRGLVFDPLFTTTDSRRSDALGSGMGLGLALVRRSAAAFGGKADLVTPPPNYTTCVEVKFPLQTMN